VFPTPVVSEVVSGERGKTTSSEERLSMKPESAASERRALLESVPPELRYKPEAVSPAVPELALARVGRSAEPVSPNIARVEAGVEEVEQQEATPDIDSIARDVYQILRRKLASERERALGVS
jgi:hypothetical protein